MTLEDFDVMETFAYFGRVMYQAQLVEMSIGIHLSGRGDNLKTDLTKDRYDELLLKRSYQSFGQLKRQFVEKMNPSNELKEKLNQAHKYRDWLAHNYWWDRSHEFYHSDKRQEMKVELDKIGELFQELSDYFSNENRRYLEGEGIDFEGIFEEISSKKTTPPSKNFRILSKNETLKGLYNYKLKGNTGVPIFVFEDDSYWTLSESGLTPWNKEIDNNNLLPIEKINLKCPMVFNPKPKVDENWNYELILKSGYILVVESIDGNKSVRFKWKLIKK